MATIISTKELEEENINLKRNLEEKEKEIASFKSKVSKHEHVVKKLKYKIECPVCMEVPRCGPVPVCPNGHFVCEKCKRDSCPTCRTRMGVGKSLLAVSVLENIEHECKFDDCNENFALAELENHETSCRHRTVGCPYGSCVTKVSLSKLIDHLLSSKQCCSETLEPLKRTMNEMNRRNYHGGDKVTAIRRKNKAINWRVHIFAIGGETFAVFPVKTSDGQAYFGLVMFASEAECSKYEFEMTVHEHEGEVVGSRTSVKIRGCPISIDLEKDKYKLYSIGKELFAKIMEISACKSAFSLSFKISIKVPE